MKKIAIVLILLSTKATFALSIMQEPMQKPMAVERYSDSVKNISRNLYLKQLNRDIDRLSQSIDSSLQKKATLNNAYELQKLDTFIENQRKMRDVLIEHRTNIERKNYSLEKL